MIEKSNLELRYKNVESALADVAGVRSKDIGAFRAKLRHLRNIGLPRLPASGSGKHIAYSRRQALEMLIAIELGNIGHKPHSAAILSQSIVRQSPYGQHEGEDWYVLPDAPDETAGGYTTASGITGVSKVIKSKRPVFTVINVSALLRRLDAALDHSQKHI